MIASPDTVVIKSLQLDAHRWSHQHVELQYLGASFTGHCVCAPARGQITIPRGVAPHDVLQHGVVSVNSTCMNSALHSEANNTQGV
jgi:hypothetical protein